MTDGRGMSNKKIFKRRPSWKSEKKQNERRDDIVGHARTKAKTLITIYTVTIITTGKLDGHVLNEKSV